MPGIFCEVKDKETVCYEGGWKCELVELQWSQRGGRVKEAWQWAEVEKDHNRSWTEWKPAANASSSDGEKALSSEGDGELRLEVSPRAHGSPREARGVRLEGAATAPVGPLGRLLYREGVPSEKVDGLAFDPHFVHRVQTAPPARRTLGSALLPTAAERHGTAPAASRASRASLSAHLEGLRVEGSGYSDSGRSTRSQSMFAIAPGGDGTGLPASRVRLSQSHSPRYEAAPHSLADRGPPSVAHPGHGEVDDCRDAAVRPALGFEGLGRAAAAGAGGAGPGAGEGQPAPAGVDHGAGRRRSAQGSGWDQLAGAPAGQRAQPTAAEQHGQGLVGAGPGPGLPLGGAQASAAAAGLREPQDAPGRVPLAAIAQQLPDEDAAALQGIVRGLESSAQDGTVSAAEVWRGMLEQGMKVPEHLEDFLRAAEEQQASSAPPGREQLEGPPQQPQGQQGGLQGHPGQPQPQPQQGQPPQPAGNHQQSASVQQQQQQQQQQPQPQQPQQHSSSSSSRKGSSGCSSSRSSSMAMSSSRSSRVRRCSGRGQGRGSPSGRRSCSRTSSRASGALLLSLARAAPAARCTGRRVVCSRGRSRSAARSRCRSPRRSAADCRAYGRRAGAADPAADAGRPAAAGGGAPRHSARRYAADPVHARGAGGTGGGGRRGPARREAAAEPGAPRPGAVSGLA
ncbi:unnamed protein product, partial [Prorocentrum cordatum]